jgi:integrase
MPRERGPTVAKAYRLLHSILATAVDDGLIRRNPCRIKGAGQEDSPERPVVPLSTLVELLDHVPARYRALLLLATFASLRFGELAALRRGDIDLESRTIRVVRSMAQMNDGTLIDDEPKSRAGRRVVSVPLEIVPELRWLWSASSWTAMTALFLSARRVADFAGRTSVTCGSRLAMRSGCLACTCTICGIPGTLWRRPRALAFAS